MQWYARRLVQLPVPITLHGRVATGWRWLLVVVLAIVAVAQLTNGFWHLTADTGPAGAVDLLLRYDEVHRWFAGEPVYPALSDAVYPPATYALLWPFLGWADPNSSRGVWVVLSGLALWWLARRAACDSLLPSTPLRLAAGLLPLSISAAGIAVGNGQLVHLLLPMCAGMVFVVRRPQRAWTATIAVAGLAIVSLAKPTLSIPFLVLAGLSGAPVWWIAILVPAYIGLTLLAAAFQAASVVELVRQWIGRSTVVATTGGYGNLHQWLAQAGLANWILPVSALVLIAFAVWAYCHRGTDTWVLLGVTGIISRLWTYHRSYDDLLILLPVLALVRVVATQHPAAKLAAGLVALMMLVLMAPSRLQVSPSPIDVLYTSTQVVTWLAALVLLLYVARRNCPLVGLRPTASGGP